MRDQREAIAGRTAEFGIAVARAADGTLWVSPAGELDLHTVPEFLNVLRRVLAEERSVLLDLRRMTFIDSQGLGAFVGCAKIAGDCDFRLAGGSPAFERLAEITGLRHVLQLVDLPDYEPPA